MIRVFVLVGLIFTFSSLLFPGCVEKGVDVTETYWETEYRYEPYSEVVEQSRVMLSPKRVFGPPLVLEGYEQLFGCYYRGYEIDTSAYPKSQIVVKPNSVPLDWVLTIYDLTGVGQIPDPPPTSYTEWKSVPSMTGMLGEGPPRFKEWVAKLEAITTDPKRVLAAVDSRKQPPREIVINAAKVKEFAIMTFAAGSSQDIISRVELVLFGSVTKERQVPYQVEKQRVVKQVKKVPFWEAVFR